MKLVVFLMVIGFVTCYRDSSYCCKQEQGVMEDDKNLCVDTVNNIITPGKLACVNVTSLIFSDFEYVLVDDGRLILYQGELMESHVEADEFCIANQTLNSNDTFLVFCDNAIPEDIVDDEVLAYCTIVSVVFLTMTAIVYSLLPEMRDLQGLSIINFCTSSAIGFMILSILKLFDYSDLALCATRGFLVYFFLLASFFWTNAISIQILLNIRRPTIYEKGWKPFIWYALYAWGCPSVLTLIMAIINFHPGYHRKPGIGLNTCWFYGKIQQWQYMYSVMSVLIVANICIFIYISLCLWRHTFSSHHISALKYKFVMTVRMFIIMGVPWVFEMISSLSGPHLIWVMLDIFNLLQGVLIFLLLVVCRKRVIKAMYKRGWLDCISGFVERHLAVGDDEEEVVHHTTDIALNDGPIK